VENTVELMASELEWSDPEAERQKAAYFAEIS